MSAWWRVGAQFVGQVLCRLGWAGLAGLAGLGWAGLAGLGWAGWAGAGCSLHFLATDFLSVSWPPAASSQERRVQFYAKFWKVGYTRLSLPASN